jgi:hypothetical protein
VPGRALSGEPGGPSRTCATRQSCGCDENIPEIEPLMVKILFAARPGATVCWETLFCVHPDDATNAQPTNTRAVITIDFIFSLFSIIIVIRYSFTYLTRPDLRLPHEASISAASIGNPTGDLAFQVIGRRTRALEGTEAPVGSIEEREGAER